MAAEDNRSLASQSPERILTNLLKRHHTKKRANDSSNVSLASNEAEHGGLLASIDRGLEKLKVRNSIDVSRRSSTDSGNKLSKLLHRRSRKKKKSKPDDTADASDGEVTRGRSNTAGTVLRNPNSKLNTESSNLSLDDLGNDKSEEGSSILTDEDSELEGSQLTKPTLETRPSHAGYLTFSSPLIEAETVDPAFVATGSSRIRALSSASATIQSNLESTNPTIHAAPSVKYSEDENLPFPVQSTSTSIGNSTAIGRPSTPQRIVDSSLELRSPSTPTNQSEAPTTLVTPATPVDSQNAQPIKPASSLLSFAQKYVSPENGVGSLPINPATQISHRRIKSATAAHNRLSGSAFAALTPAIEEANTPGGTLTQPSGAGGFFSSVVQNAVNPISQFFSNSSTSSGQRRRSNTASSGPTHDSPVEETVATSSKNEFNSQVSAPLREPAIATLGLGNLSLSHLGISDESNQAGADNESLRSVSVAQNGNSRLSHDEIEAAAAISAAYTEKPSPEKNAPVIVDHNVTGGRPRSIGSVVSHVVGDTTPPKSGKEGTAGIRSGSVRSRLSDRARKQRVNSTANGGAIAAALAASHAAVANPGRIDPQRPHGIAVASNKRNKEFHHIFKSVPDDDYLVEDYSAALQREILLQGRFYISEKHICFSSNILGWVTNLVIGFDEVVSMEKKSTAVIFHNAIVIQTLHAKNVFASFISRDPTYDLLIKIWKIGHPNLKTSANGHVLDDSTNGDKPERSDSVGTEEDSNEDSDEYYDDDEEQDGAGSFMDASPSVAGSEAGEAVRARSHRGSSPGVASQTTSGGAIKALDSQETSSGLDFPGPATHAPTECSDQDSHYDKLVLDTTIPAPLGKVYSMMYGPASGTFMRKFLLDDQKSGDLQMEDDKKGMGEDIKSFSYSFIKPLGGSIGPKQTKCIVNQTLDAFDLERAVSVTCSTQTPDVPSGSAFVTKTKYCLMWGPSNSTRLIMNCTVEWSGKSWLKGPIEKGAGDGQEKYGKDLEAFLKAHVGSRSPTKSTRTKSKGKKKRSATDASNADLTSGGGPNTAGAHIKRADWGVLEPAHEILGQVSGLLGPFGSQVGLLCLLLLIVTTLWIRASYGTSTKTNYEMPGMISPLRMAAYEELWRREESQLWNWLEDRIVTAELSHPMQDDRKQPEHVLDRNDVSNKLNEEKISQRQIDEAIRVTEERLEQLKAVVQRKRAAQPEPHSVR